MQSDGGPASSERRRWAHTLSAGARPGDVLAGKYRIDRILGMGGVGVVVAATHLQLDERVALKFLLPGALKDADAVTRFDREARAAVKIKSEHVARVTDVGKLENGAPYIVMEYLEGRDLSAVLEAGGPVASDVAVDYTLQACEAVAGAHALGIVHRDLKPSNLFLTRKADGSPHIKVLDFGISKIIPRNASQPDLGITRTSKAIGSPLYMSPEQMEAVADIDERTDIWGLGTILYELLTGRPAFDGNSMPQVCTAILHGWPQPIRLRAPQVPPELEAVVLRCLAKLPADRFADVGELALALMPFAPRRAQAAARRVVSIVCSAGVARAPHALPPDSAPMLVRSMGPLPSTQSAWGGVHTDPPALPTTRAPLVAAAIAGVLVIGAAIGFIASRRLGATTSSAPAAPPDATLAAPHEPAPNVSPIPDLPAAAPTAAPSDAATAADNAPAPSPPSAAPHRQPGSGGARKAPAPRAPGTSAPGAAHTIDPSVLDDR